MSHTAALGASYYIYIHAATPHRIISSEENQPVGSRLEIPHTGRSPDFVHHGIALPGFPVDCKAAPVHSDCIAPDSHRIPFSSALEQTPLCYNFIFFSDSGIISHFVELSIRFDGGAV